MKSPHLRQRPPAWIKRGFSLIELMIVLAIIATLAAVATPTVKRSIDRAHAKAMAREIGNTFRMARNQAMSRGEVVLAQVVPSNDGGTVTLFRTLDQARTCTMANPNAVEPVYDIDLAEKSGRMRIFGTAAAVLPNNMICFTPNGRVTTLTGAAIDGTADGCTDHNFRVWIARTRWDGTGTLSSCPSQGDRQARRDERDMEDFYMIHLPFNGDVEVTQ